MIAVTGATGQLGKLVIDALLKTVPAAEIVAVVRSPARADVLKANGVTVRQGDYDNAQCLERAFAGVDKLLLISSADTGERVHQHRNVIDATNKDKVGLIAYTSLLHADSSPLGLAAAHRETEAMLKASGLPYVLLRNGWYTENYLASLSSALQRNAFIGCAGNGRIASATRRDYAEAAAAVLTSAGQAGKVYELAGDEPYTLAELAAEVARQTGGSIGYTNLPEGEFRAALIRAGLAEPVANKLVEYDVAASKGALHDDSHSLSRLIGRSTTSLYDAVAQALKG
ncbi:SDR family oxidoreductase [Paraburkholderia sp. 22099]|uniref:NAD(P)H dehydrogenase (Quinone) n=1 Tax=Paraburkholderia terricola TaxID=169427 RepID=A0A1M6SLJ8_9BURK|nr:MULTISPECIES: SDR family oxidoreductase [Paraburkholderia]MDR6491564.1 NAD(P)H dehydrogenase (quinone) [Paraburkholderia terricola]ORC52728.1 NAD(P)-dependent oxidoreductase [Burkholderia sp. A27]SDO65571.1 NAD(P)H dehydrogenase (quinone) [Paraburkholderia sediminicola]SHK45575.1 NAD(P)H dehydrogenase (quinone) [Paraburkholderia terricola]